MPMESSQQAVALSSVLRCHGLDFLTLTVMIKGVKKKVFMIAWLALIQLLDEHITVFHADLICSQFAAPTFIHHTGAHILRNFCQIFRTYSTYFRYSEDPLSW